MKYSIIQVDREWFIHIHGEKTIKFTALEMFEYKNLKKKKSKNEKYMIHMVLCEFKELTISEMVFQKEKKKKKQKHMLLFGSVYNKIYHDHIEMM